MAQYVLELTSLSPPSLILSLTSMDLSIYIYKIYIASLTSQRHLKE